MLEKTTALLTALGAAAWMAQQPSWEPAIILLGALGALIGFEIRDQRKWQRVNSGAASSDPAAEQLEHDRTLFRRYEELLSEERLINHLSNRLYGAARTDVAFLDNLRRYLDLAQRGEGRFLIGEVQMAMDRLQRHLGELDDFIGQNFFSNEGPTDTLYLLPHVKVDDAEAFHREYDRLKALIDDVERACKAFRHTVKERLVV